MNITLYETGAHMVGFRIKSKERLKSWIRAATHRYQEQMDSFSEYFCEWKDRLSKHSDTKVGEIFIQLYNAQKTIKYLTIHIYLTTYYYTVQGIQFTAWAEQEFDFLKSIVEAHEAGTNTSVLLNIYATNFEDFFSSLNDSQETNLKRASTTRVVVPLPQNKSPSIITMQKTMMDIQEALQHLETSVCDLNKKKQQPLNHQKRILE